MQGGPQMHHHHQQQLQLQQQQQQQIQFRQPLPPGVRPGMRIMQPGQFRQPQQVIYHLK